MAASSSSSSSASPLGRITLTGLVKQPQLNGQHGIISGFADGRFIVELDHHDKPLAIKPQNVACGISPTVGRAWRSMDGIFDGGTDDEDEYIADAKRQRIGNNNSMQRDSTVRLLPKSGRGVVSIVATADLHRHHDERYLVNNSLSLAEWYESSHSPAHIDLALFAGDLGLEMERETTSPKHTLSDEETLKSWRGLLRAMLAAKPMMHICIVGGNHDGLLCGDDACLVCTRPSPKGYGRQPSAARRANLEVMLGGVPGAERVHVLFDEAADVKLASGDVVRVVGSPWTSYETHGVEHMSICHAWRPLGGFIFGINKTLGQPEAQSSLDCAEWWRQHWAKIGRLLEAQKTETGEAIAASMLVTHTPPHGIMDIVGGTKDNPLKGVNAIDGSTRRVGCDALRVMLEGLERPPIFHCYGHVHAKQRRDEPPEGPRLAASKRVPSTLFANVAAERQLPVITGYRLSTKGAAARLDSGELFALPAPGARPSSAIVPYSMPPLTAEEYVLKKEPERLLMRPPVAVTLPLNGFACDCASWADLWEVEAAHQ